MRSNPNWPVLTRYDQDHLLRIALPLGGIGTGTVSLGGRGDLRDWEIVNRPAKGFSPRSTFFALYAKAAGQAPVARALEGPIDPVLYEGGSGCAVPNHSLPRFSRCSFHAAYPLGQVLLSDSQVPLEARIEAFNPLVPADADASGMPLAVMRFVLTNKTGKTVDAAVCGNLANFIGSDGSAGAAKGNVNTFRRDGGLSGLLMSSGGVSPAAEQFGTLALATTAGSGVTHRTAWARLSWGDSVLDFWDDFSSDGRLENRDASGEDSPVASLCVSVRVPPRATRSVTFLLTWHFPNRMTWTPKPAAAPTLSSASPGDAAQAQPCSCDGGECKDPNWVGNYYTTRYADAWQAAVAAGRELPSLEKRTLQFVRAFCDSDLPAVVREAALNNLTGLRSQTTFRTADGRVYGWEGCHDKAGCCHGSCTHVWNYEHATGFLFGDLSLRMREVEFHHATDETGLMSFRVNLPIQRAGEFKLAAADGQMGTIMRLYRDWQLSGDETMLRGLWPAARRAMEFCWIPGGWDADKDGVMEGCQHNTMDVEYFGPNGQMSIWYLGALRAAEEMARHVGQTDFADTCRDLYARGRQWIDSNLFNGEFYEHRIVPPLDASKIAKGLVVGMGDSDLADPKLQLGKACLIDQLVGQYTAHVCGLGHIVDPQHARAALDSVMKYNYRANLRGHFNHMRSYALCDEPAVLMATYPRGERPRRPFPYCNEVMTGFEYTAAVGMLYEGRTGDGLKVISAVRSRYDGRKRSPFDEAECGHHYARAMASWSAVLAMTGFHYSGVTGAIEFAVLPRGGEWFWSNGYAWGTCRQRKAAGDVAVELRVLGGELKVAKLTLKGFGAVDWKAARTIKAGASCSSRVRKSGCVSEGQHL